MSASPEPTEDGELLRLLDAYGQAEYELGSHASNRRYDRQQESRAALLSHITTHYVRRDRSDPWGAVLESVGDTMTVPARAARYGKEELADGSDHR